MIYEFAVVLTSALIALKYNNIPLSLSLSFINQECIKEVMNMLSQSWVEKGREAGKTCCSNFKSLGQTWTVPSAALLREWRRHALESIQFTDPSGVRPSDPLEPSENSECYFGCCANAHVMLNLRSQ